MADYKIKNHSKDKEHKQARLNQALRDNLFKRKQQQRARQAGQAIQADTKKDKNG